MNENQPCADDNQMATAIGEAVAALASHGIDVTSAQLEQARDNLLATFPQASPDSVERALWQGVTQSRSPLEAGAPLPVKAKRPPRSALFRSGDYRATGVLERATRALERWLIEVRWDDPVEALVAVTVVALLRLDVHPSGKAVAAWLACPWEQLLPYQDGQLPRAPVRPLDTLTRFALGRLQRAHPAPADTPLGAYWLAAHVPRIDGEAPHESGTARQLAAAARAMIARCEAVVAPWLQDQEHAFPRVASLIGAWCRVHWSPLLHTLSEPDATSPLSPHSAMRWELGAAPASLPVTASPGAGPLALQPDTHQGVDGWLAPMQADRALAALVTQLRGDKKKGHHVTSAQGRELVRRCKSAHRWGYLEQLILRWVEGKLDGRSPIRSSSAVRYLSGLRKLVQAQGCTPLVYLDARSGRLQANADQWEIALEVVAMDCDDQQALGHISQFFSSLLDVLPGLDSVDEGVLEILGEACQPAAHVVSPSEFSAAIEPLWNAGGAGESAALGAALAFYLGVRRMEVMRLLAADLLDLKAGLLQIRSHRARRTKTRNATRRILVRPWLPEVWWHRLRDRAMRLQHAGRDRPGPIYLLAEPHAPAQLPTAGLVEAVVGALRAATGDGQLTFHSLRHSFLTWNVLRLAVHEQPLIRAFPAAIMAEPGLESEALVAWVQAWRPASALPCDGALLHELSRIAGHGSPRTTLRWYTHVAGLVLRAHTTLELPQPGRRTLHTLLGLTMPKYKALEQRAQRAQPAGMGLAHSAWAIHALSLGIKPRADRTALDNAPLVLPALSAREVPEALTALARVGSALEAARQLRVEPSGMERLLANQPGMRPWRALTEMHYPLFLAACAALNTLGHLPATSRALAYWATGRVRNGTRVAWDEASGLPALLALLGPMLSGVGDGTRLHIELRPLRSEGLRPNAKRALAALRMLLEAAGLGAAIVRIGPRCVPFTDTAASGTGFKGHRVVLRLGRPTSTDFAVERGLMAALDAACLLR